MYCSKFKRRMHRILIINIVIEILSYHFWSSISYWKTWNHLNRVKIAIPKSLWLCIFLQRNFDASKSANCGSIFWNNRIKNAADLVKLPLMNSQGNHFWCYSHQLVPRPSAFCSPIHKSQRTDKNSLLRSHFML